MSFLKILKNPLFIWVALAHLGLAMAWSLCMPMHESPDEQNHYRYMVFLKDQGRLPKQWPLPSEVPGEGHQPPLYYLAGALALKAFAPAATFKELPRNPDLAFNANAIYFQHKAEEEPGLLRFTAVSGPPHLLRLLQWPLVLLGLAMVWLSLSLVFDASSLSARLAWLLVALNPGWVSLSGALNNDHALIPLFAAALLGLAIMAKKESASLGQALGLGFLLGVGAMAKIAVLGLLPLAVIVLWMYGKPGQRAGRLALASLGFVLVAGPWMARNQALYGDPLGWWMHTQTCVNTVNPKSVLNFHWWGFWLNKSLESGFGVFGWFTWSLLPWQLWLGKIVFAGAGLGLLLQARRIWQDRAVMVFGAGFFLLALGVAKFNLSFDPPEGRYFFPGLGALAVLLAMGFDAWLKNAPVGWGRRLPQAVLLLLLTGHVWLLAYRMLPLYYNGL
jgi:4-amino-4-deoxy-L-arabinose transferase-like glycosyltransferase